MAFLAVFPALVWMVLATLKPVWLPSLGAANAILLAAVIGILLLLILFFRQWRWGYWAAWLAGAVTPLQLAATSSPIINAMPVWLTLSALLLAFSPLPSLRTNAGKLLFLAVAAAPFALLDTSIATLVASLNPAALLSLPQWPYGYPLAVVAVSTAWATYLLFRDSSAFGWAQWSAWLVLMSYLGLSVPTAELLTSSVVVAIIGFIVALADQLLRLAYIDELTGLPQRRALLSQLQHLKRRSAVCMLDVDHFKKFNDRYGHDVGDQVLRLLGHILQNARGIKAYRYGGEEFTLIINDNDPKRLKQRLDEVRDSVASYPLALRNDSRPADAKAGKSARGQSNTAKTVKITISLGAVVRQRGDTAETLLKRADEKLYAAKKAGRNRVVI